MIKFKFFKLKHLHVTYLFLFVILISSLAGCATLDQMFSIRTNIDGVWGFKDPAMGPIALTFKEDETYELDTDGNGAKDIWGVYHVTEEWIILNDVGGCFAPDCGQKGAYVYKIEKDEAWFKLIADQCPYRAQALAVVWKRK